MMNLYRVQQSNHKIFLLILPKQIKTTQVEFYVIYLKTSFFKIVSRKYLPRLASHILGTLYYYFCNTLLPLTYAVHWTNAP